MYGRGGRGKGICRQQGDSLDTTIMRPARQPLQSEYKRAPDGGQVFSPLFEMKSYFVERTVLVRVQ